MRREAANLQDWRRTRERIKDIIEAPDVEINSIICSIRQNGGAVSGKLVKESPVLEEVGEDVVRAVDPKGWQ